MDFPPLVRGRLIKRYKRFLADVVGKDRLLESNFIQSSPKHQCEPPPPLYRGAKHPVECVRRRKVFIVRAPSAKAMQRFQGVLKPDWRAR